ncbi:hypothetical protein Rhal01_03187 [Rubritalea halochordaticola]|uniref:Uncharacterized protein n=1 Tax=Rubritalea halochordaticola TaxID=714537 RepID=A0ABP9V618_9BACT
MNTPKIAALILGVGVASAGVTFYLSNEEKPVAPAESSSTETSPKPKATESVTKSAPVDREERPDRRPGGPGRFGGGEDREESPAPEGIDQDAWNDAQRSMRFIYGFVEGMQDPDNRWRRRMQDRVTRDSEAIAKSLGLEGESAEKVQELLNGRMTGSLENSTKIMNGIIANEQGYLEYRALREMSEDDKDLTATQQARLDQLKNDIFGQYYPEGQEVSNDPFRDLIWRNPSNGDWYEDNAFLVKAAAEMPEQEGADLLEYAGKLDYLDRKEYATDRVINIQRSVDLSSEQTQQLNDLYLENRNPSDEQLSQIVSPDQLEAVKSAGSERRWGRRGRR